MSTKSTKSDQARVEELEAQVTYLRTQLGQLLEEKRRWVHSPTPTHHDPVIESEEEEVHQSRANSSDEEAPYTSGPTMSSSMSIKRCSKCQGFGHTPSDCPNKEFITLAEWEAAMKEEREVSYPFILNGEDHYQENNDVNFDLPPVFDVYNEVDDEANWSLPPRFDEHEPSPIFHPPLTLLYATLQLMPLGHFLQELPFHKHDSLHEKLANPLSLRTNSKQPGEYDAYFHMHHFYSSPISKKKRVKEDHAWKCAYLVLLREFKDSRHYGEVKKRLSFARNLVPPSSRNFPIFVCTFGLAQVDPQLEAPHGFEV